MKVYLKRKLKKKTKMMEKELLPTEYSFLNAVKRLFFRLLIVTVIGFIDFVLLVSIFPFYRNPLLSLLVQFAFLSAMVTIFIASLKSRTHLNKKVALSKGSVVNRYSQGQKQAKDDYLVEHIAGFTQPLPAEPFHRELPIIHLSDLHFNNNFETVDELVNDITYAAPELSQIKILPLGSVLPDYTWASTIRKYSKSKLLPNVTLGKVEIGDSLFKAEFDPQRKTGKIIIQYKSKEELLSTINYITENINFIASANFPELDPSKKVVEVKKNQATTSSTTQTKSD
jgi:hypothetical protein